MVRVILKRIGLAFLTLFGVTVIVFALLQMMPGEPIDSIVPLDASEELRQVIIDQYGFDQPLYMQYFMWLGNAVRGNFGNSVSDNRLVLSVVSEALHNTLILALGASIFAFLLSILIGVYSSYRPNSIFSWIGTVFGIGGISIPNYCLSLILIGIFSVNLRLLPSTGMYTSGDYTFSSLIQHLILPAIAAGAMTLGIMTRMVRSSVSEMMPVSRQTAISWAAQAYISSGRISFSSSSQSSAMASLSMASTPVAREQNSSASQAVIFWSGAKVVALVPLTTPWVARYSTSSLAQ